MTKFLKKQKLSEDVYLFKFVNPNKSDSRPGQFIALQLNEERKKTPFLISDTDSKTLSIVVSVKSPEGKILSKLKRNAEIRMLGPMGRPLKIKEYGNVCLICEGAGLGPLYNIGRALKKAGNKVVVIAGFSTRKQKFWEKKFSRAADKFVAIIDKKNNITHGIVTELHNWLGRKHLGFVLANCEPAIMRELARITRLRAKTYVFLTPKIRDGVGMCGSCRITYKNETRFACIDGPAFNAHKIDWDEVMNKHRIWNECQCND